MSADPPKVKDNAKHLLEMIDASISGVPQEELEKAIEMLVGYKDKKVLVIGAGRSGLVGKAFAMRLLHLGYSVSLLGETLVPSISEEDLVFAISGSGTTKLVVTATEVAKQIGAKVIALTSYPDSKLGKMADHVIELKGRTLVAEDVAKRDYFNRQLLGLYEPLAPLGTLFEDAAVILLDSLIVSLMAKINATEDDLRKRHANIE